MAQPREYRFEQRSEGRGAVVRIGDKGGKKVITVYRNQSIAQHVVDFLNGWKHGEA